MTYNPYSGPTLTGYNATPPSDDGSETANNTVEWAKHIGKIGDPLKTYAQAVDSAVSSAFGAQLFNNRNAQTTTYTVQASDAGKVISCTGTFTVTLLASATADTGFVTLVENVSTGTITVDGNASETINGETTVTVPPDFTLLLQSDGTNWLGYYFAPKGTVVELTRGTVSSAASLDLTAGTWSLYKEIRLRFYDFIPATDNTILQMRTSSDGGSSYDSGASDYAYVIQRSDDTATNDILRQSGTTAIDIVRDCGSDTGESASGEIKLRNPSGTLHTLIRAHTENRNSAGNLQMHDVGARRSDGADVDGVQLLFSSGNISSGSYVLEGLR